ncbi:MAG: alanine racemase [Desulfovibrio sp.]|jgi:alanine racemase|nr:alanine racemase [Desulfovibrio sp.]
MSDPVFAPGGCIIDLGAIVWNFARLGEPERLMPVIKSDAYGHGLVPVARALEKAGAKRFAVGTVNEAQTLREAGVGGDIHLLLNAMTPESWRIAAASRIVPLIATADNLRQAAECLPEDGSFPVTLKWETGMGRLGFEPEEVPDVVDFLRAHRALNPVLALSHLSCADDPDQQEYSRGQIARFTEITRALREAFPGLKRSLANSAATLGMPESHFDICRPGISLYGDNPLVGTVRENMGRGLVWAMSVWTPILQVRNMPPGRSVSYGRLHTTQHPEKVAVLAAGYATGIDRSLTNRMEVLIRGRRAPQVGRVCMGMFMVDVSGIPGVREGDKAWILGGEAEPGHSPVNPREMAGKLGTISYEVLCRMGAANARSYVATEAPGGGDFQSAAAGLAKVLGRE